MVEMEENRTLSLSSMQFSKWCGAVVSLHRAPRAFLPMGSFDELNLISGYGVEGDRYATKQGFYSHKPEEGRQVSFFEVETLEALLRDHGITLHPEEHRRNVMTRGVPLNHLVGRRFRVGDAVVEATRLSVPCRHIEEITGQEIFNPLINRSGLNAKILKGAVVRVGDPILPF